MSSIDQDTLERLAGPLFEALTAGAAQRPPFPLAPDASAASYYTRRDQTFMQRGDFDAPSCVDPADFERRLAEYWRRAGQADLAACAPMVCAAARELKARCAVKPAGSEVSPYIYSMF